ncbi:hypothetical protein LCGC14_0946110 [marine sediment metagenome]|uniref:Uncharacterized protein n=1 Tax=marine sediment metagenome TaxID=412755 RepID=A0A0F9NIR1_9ZZZZ
MYKYSNTKEKHKESKDWFVVWLVVAFLFIVGLALSGCGTVQGVGKVFQGVGGDIRWLSEAVEEKMQK